MSPARTTASASRGCGGRCHGYAVAMAKHRLVLDTNIYRKNPRRDDLPFSALSRLCKADVVQLYIPYVVLREFQTQQGILSRSHFSSAVSAARSLEKMPGMPADAAASLHEFVDHLVAQEADIAIAVEGALSSWATDNKAIVVQLNTNQALAAMEAYFNGMPPLKSPKERKDIPDSMIFQAIAELASDALTVICEDGNLGTACASLQNVTTFIALADFIESPAIQDEIKELDVIENIGPIVDAIEQFDKETAEISSAIRSSLGEALMWKKIESYTIPDDNHEATISGYSDPEEVELDYGEAAYFGDGEFGIPFKVTLWVSGFYYLFKSDIYRSEGRDVSLTDHNDHYYEAEEQFEVQILGLVKVICDRDELDPKGIDEAITSITIDSIEQIRLATE